MAMSMAFLMTGLSHNSQNGNAHNGELAEHLVRKVNGCSREDVCGKM